MRHLKQETIAAPVKKPELSRLTFQLVMSVHCQGLLESETGIFLTVDVPFSHLFQSSSLFRTGFLFGDAFSKEDEVSKGNIMKIKHMLLSPNKRSLNRTQQPEGNTPLFSQ